MHEADFQQTQGRVSREVIREKSKSQLLRNKAMKLRDHFALRNVTLQHSDRDVFVTSKCRSRTPYLAWRMFWAVYHSSWLGANLVLVAMRDDASVARWFIYLSNWVYMILTAGCVLDAAVVMWTWNRKLETTEGARLPWYLQLLWLLSTLSVVGAFMVSVWYWTLIHKGKQLTAIRFNTHATSLIYVILNMAVSRVPLRLLHFIYPVAMGVLYTLFSAIYYAFGGTNQNGDAYIYSILDWSRSGRTLAISSLSNFILIPLVHIMLWSLNLCFNKAYNSFRLRRVVYNQALDSGEGTHVDIG